MATTAINNYTTSENGSAMAMNKTTNSNLSLLSSLTSSSPTSALSVEQSQSNISQSLSTRKRGLKWKTASEKLNFIEQFINKYNVTEFISKQKYKAHQGTEYYKAFNHHHHHHHHQKPHQKDFHDYIKEYDEEKYETNPYIQEYYEDIEKEENDIDNDDEDENENEDNDSIQKLDISKKGYIKNKFNEKSILLSNIFIKHDNEYEYQEIPLLEKKNNNTNSYNNNNNNNKERQNEKRMNLSYYQQSYDDERNSRNIYLRDEDTMESFMKIEKEIFNQNEINRKIFIEMQKRRNELRQQQQNQSYQREKFGEELIHLQDLDEKQKSKKKNEYYYFCKEDYEMKQKYSIQQRIEDQLQSMSDYFKKLQIGGGREENDDREKGSESTLIVDIQNEDEEKEIEEKDKMKKKDERKVMEEEEEEEQGLLNLSQKTLKKSVSFNLNDDYYYYNNDEYSTSPHEPIQKVNPSKLKSCLSKQSINYDIKLMNSEKDSNKRNSFYLNDSNNYNDDIKFILKNEESLEMNPHINDNFGNYFTGYTFKNFYFFKGKNIHLMSMFNPKLFYREYFGDDSNTLKSSPQSIEKFMNLFKMINLYRSIITTIYGVYELYKSKYKEEFI